MRHSQKASKKNACVFFIVLPAYFLVSSFFISNTQKGAKFAFHFTTQDSAKVNVDALFDIDSVITGYRALVETPICEDTVCYAVRLYFFWDVLGDFQKYELIPGMPLTKQEHEPFTKNDHEVLLRLLKKKAPALANLNKKDLIAKKKEDEVDGYTGATISAVKNEVVSGAVYSCYTLWHIANGPVKDSIQLVTSKQLSPTLVKQIMHFNSPEAPYFLIRNFKRRDFFTYKTEVLEMLRTSEGYFAKEALSIIPDNLIQEQDFQDSLASIYTKLDYFAQKQLLERLEGRFNSSTLAIQLANSMDHRNSSQNSLIIQLFCSNAGKLETTALQYFIQQICDKQVKLSKDEFKQIADLDRSNKDLKAQIKLFKQNYKNEKKGIR